MGEERPMSDVADPPRRFDWRRVLGRLLAIVVGVVFIYAGVLKIRDPLHFASDINNYQMVRWSVGIRMAFYLPWLEVLCGLALIFHRLFAGAVAITTFLMVIFIGATTWARMQGIDVSCGCFGSASSNLSLTWHLILDAGLLFALVYVWFTRERLA
jgi:putative oxidoreductase